MSWYVHRTMTGREFDAVIALRDYGYTVYVPWIDTRTRRGARQRAFFPGYIFCKGHIVRREHREAIIDRLERPLVLGAITCGGTAIPIPEHLIAKIAIEAARERMGDEVEPYAPRFKPGDIGIIRSGPFEGHGVTVESVDGDAARVALSIFNAIHSIETSVENIGAAA